MSAWVPYFLPESQYTLDRSLPICPHDTSPRQLNPFLNRDQPTLADVLRKVEANTELKPGRRSQLCSSIRAVGRVLGLPLAGPEKASNIIGFLPWERRSA